MSEKILVSPEYQALLQRQHKETIWGGNRDFRHMTELLTLIQKSPAFAKAGMLTILDYGAGRESLRAHVERERFPFAVTSYDPGTGKHELPEKADFVVCCDVLEHIEPPLLFHNLERIFSIAQKAIYLVIALRQAKAPMVDGSPAHLIVQQASDWIDWLTWYPDRWRMDWATFKDDKELRCWIVRNE